jgi:NADPH2:quinone reductase
VPSSASGSAGQPATRGPEPVRAIVVTRFGGPEVLALEEREAPSPGPGQLLVDVSVAGVNFRDVYEREGSYGGEAPLVAGVEGAGTVASVGEGVAGFSPGDRVAWVAAPGSYAEQVVLEARNAVAVPAGLGDELAAAALLQGVTAHYLCTSTFPVAPGDAAVVHAAAGGVGLLLTQLVKRRGGRVLATASTPEKAELARGAGADEVLGYEGFAERVRELTGGEGAAVVFDGVGQATFEESLRALRPRGMLVLYGAASGRVPPFDLQRLGPSGSLFVTRPLLGNYTATREELEERASAVFGWLAEGSLDVRIGGRYPLEEARRAQEDLQARRTTGKLLLLVR